MAERIDDDRERIAVLEAKVGDVREEVRGLRARYHELAGKVSGLIHLGKQVDDLTRSVDGLRDDLPGIVRDNSRQVAEDVMQQGMEKRDELERARWGLRIQWMALGVGTSGLVLGLIYHFAS